jgi:uncharacterized membrane protein
VLAGYGHVQADLVERIVRMAETEAEHRRSIELSIVRSGLSRARLGQWFGLFIGVAGMLTAAYCAHQGDGVVAGIVATIDLVSLVSVFVVGSRARAKNAEPPAPPAPLTVPHVE